MATKKPDSETPPQKWAVTYCLGHGKDAWQVLKLDVDEKGGVTSSVVYSHPSRLVARGRLMVLLQSLEVLT